MRRQCGSEHKEGSVVGVPNEMQWNISISESCKRHLILNGATSVPKKTESRKGPNLLTILNQTGLNRRQVPEAVSQADGSWSMGILSNDSVVASLFAAKANAEKGSS